MWLPVLDDMADIWKAEIEHWRNIKKTDGSEKIVNLDEDCTRG